MFFLNSRGVVGARPCFRREKGGGDRKKNFFQTASKVSLLGLGYANSSVNVALVDGLVRFLA